MKSKKNIVFIILILLFSVVDITYAYFTESESFENDFVVADFNVVIEENFEQDIQIYDGTNFITKEVFVVNKKNTPAIIRISYNEVLESYLSEDVDSLSYLFNSEFSYSAFEFDWTEEFDNYFVYENGWFYYLKVLPANANVQIMNGISVNHYEVGDHYNVDFNIEAVQATPEAVKEIWGWEIEIDESGNIFYNFPDS